MCVCVRSRVLDGSKAWAGRGKECKDVKMGAVQTSPATTVYFLRKVANLDSCKKDANRDTSGHNQQLLCR